MDKIFLVLQQGRMSSTALTHSPGSGWCWRVAVESYIAGPDRLSGLWDWHKPAACSCSGSPTGLFTWLVETERFEGDVVGDNDGEAALFMADWIETAEMWLGRVSRKGGRSVWLWAGEEDADLEPVEECVQFICSVQTSIYLIVYLTEACAVIHSWPHISYVVLLELVLQLYPVHLLVVSNLSVLFILTSTIPCLPRWWLFFSCWETLWGHWWSRIYFWESTSLFWWGLCCPHRS